MRKTKHNGLIFRHYRVDLQDRVYQHYVLSARTSVRYSVHKDSQLHLREMHHQALNEVLHGIYGSFTGPILEALHEMQAGNIRRASMKLTDVLYRMRCVPLDDVLDKD